MHLNYFLHFKSTMISLIKFWNLCTSVTVTQTEMSLCMRCTCIYSTCASYAKPNEQMKSTTACFGHNNTSVIMRLELKSSECASWGAEKRNQRVMVFHSGVFHEKLFSSRYSHTVVSVLAGGWVMNFSRALDGYFTVLVSL